MKQANKVISKYYRIRMTNEIREMLEALPLRDVIESQVGNYVYSGYGELRIESSWHPVVVRIQLVQKAPWVYITSPRARIDVRCEFAVHDIEYALNEAISKSMN